MIEQIKQALSLELSAKDAHTEITLSNRNIRIKAYKQSENPRSSAVCVLLYYKNGEAFFVLIQRNAYQGTHSAQISLPGGKYEEHDINLEATALRETEEEIGVNRNDVQLLGRLEEVYIPPSNFLVTPFVGVVTDLPIFLPDEREVNHLIEVPLSTFLRTEVVSRTIFIGEQKQQVRGYDLDGKVVWGATAMILNEFRHRILKVNSR